MTGAENDLGMSEIFSPEAERASAQVQMLETLRTETLEEQEVEPINVDARGKPRPIRTSLDESADEDEFWDSIYAQEEWEEELQSEREPPKHHHAEKVRGAMLTTQAQVLHRVPSKPHEHPLVAVRRRRRLQQLPLPRQLATLQCQRKRTALSYLL